jgi:hypothetical protein
MSVEWSDVSDLRHLVARDAQIVVRSLRRREHPNVDASLDYLISRAYRSPDVLLDARNLLGEPDAEARALLYRAARLARYPIEPSNPGPSALLVVRALRNPETSSRRERCQRRRPHRTACQDGRFRPGTSPTAGHAAG